MFRDFKTSRSGMQLEVFQELQPNQKLWEYNTQTSAKCLVNLSNKSSKDDTHLSSCFTGSVLFIMILQETVVRINNAK